MIVEDERENLSGADLECLEWYEHNRRILNEFERLQHAILQHAISGRVTEDFERIFTKGADCE